MKKNLLSLLFFFSLMASSFAITDICDITVSPDSKPASFANGEDVTVYLSYTTDQPAGVRIYVRPYSNGSLSPNYSANASQLYMGSGVASGSYSIQSGTVLVDEIRIEVYNSTGSTLLRRLWVPVQHRFGNSGVNHFTYSHSPNLSSFLHEEEFTTYFKYNVNYPGGARVFIRPYTNGNLTPDYDASGSAVFTGSGSANASFTIKSGKNVHVDELRVRVVSADQTVTIDEFFIPINLYFSTVKVKSIIAQAGNYPHNNETRTVSYSYSITEAGGARIFTRPMTNGSETPYFSGSGSTILTGNGTKNGNFTITSTNQKVDQARIRATNSDQSEVLLEIYVPVDYTFGKFLLENIDFCPSSAARMLNGPKVNINYNYTNDMGTSARVFIKPYTNGSPSPGYAVSGSPIHGIGSGSESTYFKINTGNVTVDQLKFTVTNSDQSELIEEFFIPVHYVFGEATVATTALRDVVSAIDVFPNPTVDDVYLNVLLKEDQAVHVAVMDLAGRLLLDLGTRDLKSQTAEQWHITGNTLSPGTYVAMIQGDGFKTAKKFVVVR